ncbi:restriction endonuclease subunit S [Acidithiobacillus thiooxidans]|uniref:restriction endonuclease subunit S n=1 Tax=Acidithiobacillus thiooxidans TaxID=930 RepID=UPI003568C60B
MREVLNAHTNLPNGWEWVAIGETGEYINGFAFKPSHRESNGLPIVRIQNLTDESKPLNYTTLEVHPDYRIDSGDMLMSWSATLDVFVWRRGPALVNQHIFKVVPNDQLISKSLLFYWLKIAIQQLQETEHLHGSTMLHVNRGPFMAHQVPLPPDREQTRIVEKLEELLSDLDAGVAELKAAQKKLAQYRQSLLKAAVEGALTAEWRQQHLPTETGAQLLQRILTERRARWEAKQLAKFKEQDKTPPKDWQKKYPEPVQPDTSGLPELPQGWVWASVDQLSPDDLANGRSVPTAENGAKVLRLTAIKAGAVDLHEHKLGAWSSEEAAPFAVSEGDLLIVRGNGSLTLVGRAGLVGSVDEQVAYPDTMIRLRVVEAVVSPAWIGLVWDSHVVRSHLERRARTSAGIYKIAQPDIVSATVPVPGLAEQVLIRQALAQQFEQLAAMESAMETGLKQSAAQRQNILRAAFAGQLVPQDPADEPASVLLARIRAERAERDTLKTPRRSKAKEPA